MEKCNGVVVASAIFNDHDKIRQPKGLGSETLRTVCFFMFIDDATHRVLASHNILAGERGEAGTDRRVARGEACRRRRRRPPAPLREPGHEWRDREVPPAQAVPEREVQRLGGRQDAAHRRPAAAGALVRRREGCGHGGLQAPVQPPHHGGGDRDGAVAQVGRRGCHQGADGDVLPERPAAMVPYQASISVRYCNIAQKEFAFSPSVFGFLLDQTNKQLSYEATETDI